MSFFPKKNIKTVSSNIKIDHFKDSAVIRAGTNRRAVLCVMLCAILLVTGSFLSGKTQSYAAQQEYIKVGLSYGASAASSVTLSSDSGFAIAQAGGSGILSPGNTLTYNTITLQLSGQSVKVVSDSGTVLATLKGDGTECIVGGSYASSSSDTVKFNSKNYRGGIMPYINSSGQMNIINFLSLDDYVRGVLHSEIGQSSALEAIKAQAVAVRSYAYTKAGTHSSQGFDVCVTTHCQVYSGADSEYTSTNLAVDETKGEMIYYGGSPVAAYYFANSGGHTENSEDTWTAALGYLRGKVDEYSPDLTWTVSLTRAELTSALNAKGVGTVESISIDSVNDSGYAASVTVVGSRKTVTYTKESIRSALGTSLKSRNFTFSAEGATVTYSDGTQPSQTGTDSTSSANTYYGRNQSSVSELGESLTVLSASGKTVRELNGTTILGANGQVTASTGTLGTSTSGTATHKPVTVTFSSDSDVLIINGNGSGHGVGMSQQGAQQMGKLGFTYKEILEYYYTGIEVK